MKARLLGALVALPLVGEGLFYGGGALVLAVAAVGISFAAGWTLRGEQP